MKTLRAIKCAITAFYSYTFSAPRFPQIPIGVMLCLIAVLIRISNSLCVKSRIAVDCLAVDYNAIA